MFTGIISAVGRISRVEKSPGGLKLRIDAAQLDLSDVATGDSIAVSGVCLTVIALDAQQAFDVDVSHETLACVAGFAEGDAVNLEKALRLSDRLGGHMVSGHVDGVGMVRRFDTLGDNCLLTVETPPPLSKYIARKGSIAVNGVSLTVNEIAADTFSVNLIPHTLQHTNLEHLHAGKRVNVEVDLIARYLEQLTSESGFARP
jgi:riboflavin synthase